MKKVFLLSLLVLNLKLTAQTTYTLSGIPYAPGSFTAGTLITIGDDQYSPAINLPFPFCFYDSSYQSLLIGSNGVLNFNSALANSYCQWPISAPAPGPNSMDKTIFISWQDLFPPGGGTIHYDVTGAAPYREFRVSFYAMPLYSCSAMFFTAQVILYETTNVIEVHIANKPICAGWNGGAAILGMENDNSTGDIVPGHNHPTQWSETLSAFRFSPVGPCAGISGGSLISGMVYKDNNANCTYDAGDLPLPNNAVFVNGGVYYTWTDQNGNYALAVDTGTWAITHAVPNYFQGECPASGAYSVYFNSGGQSSVNNDFADTLAVFCSDLNIGVTTSPMVRCTDRTVYVSYCNNGTIPDSSIDIVMFFEDSLTVLSAGVPYVALGNNQFTFSVPGTLNPGQCGNFNIQVHVGCSPAGTVDSIVAWIQGASYDCNMNNNEIIDTYIILTSFDPNEKVVASQDFTTNGWVQSEMISSSDQLDYRINFQNTGTSPAIMVELRDTLPSWLDPTSVVHVGASHAHNWTVIGNVVIFRFDNINLPDSNTNEPASHGNARFRVSQVPGNVDGTHILNQAAIYFDQNPPVITNFTDNLICDGVPTSASSIEISPSEYCVGDVVTLTQIGGNFGTNGNWIWNSGECTTGPQVGLGNSISYTVNGNTTINVHASSLCGESNCTQITLNPMAAPLASFSFVDNNGTLTFTDLSTDATSWAWNFGDWTSSTLQNPVHTYATSGSYTVTLTVTNACGTHVYSQEIATSVVTSVSAGLIAQVKIYPNPTRGTLYLELPAAAGKVQVTLMDAAGKVIMAKAIEGGMENILELNAAKGYYLLQLKGSEFEMTTPVVVE